MQATTVTVKILDGKMFSKGLQYARRHEGQYNAASKTWTVTLRGSATNMLNAPAAYGWKIVDTSVPSGVEDVRS